MSILIFGSHFISFCGKRNLSGCAAFVEARLISRLEYKMVRSGKETHFKARDCGNESSETAL